MEPQIQYAKTSDGFSIAFWTLGEGEPIIEMPLLNSSHIQQEWNVPQLRLLYERLAERRMLIRYDGRGTGLSQRGLTSFSLDDAVRDLEAVVEQLNLERFALLGVFNSGSAAIAYACRHPEPVSHLLLWGTWATLADLAPGAQALRAIADQDLDLYANAIAGVLSMDESKPFTEWIREGVTQEDQNVISAGLRDVDVTPLLSQVTSPTLVLHRRQFAFPAVDAATRIASRVPGARLSLLEGGSAFMAEGDLDAALAAIDDFLDAGSPTRHPTKRSSSERSVPQGTAVILFADIVESTALTERMGDTPFREKARELDEALRTIIREAEGTPVEGKLLGDGVLAVFAGAKNAIDAALRFGAAGEAVGLGLHLGIHAGDVIREEGNVFGGAVNIAARISGESEAGEVLVSDTVRGLARTSAGVSFEDRGERELKGVGEPVRVWAVVEA